MRQKFRRIFVWNESSQSVFAGEVRSHFFCTVLYEASNANSEESFKYEPDNTEISEDDIRKIELQHFKNIFFSKDFLNECTKNTPSRRFLRYRLLQIESQKKTNTLRRKTSFINL